MPPLPQVLAELAAPVAERVAQSLAQGRGTKAQQLTIPTRLTEANRSAGRDSVRVKPKREDKRELKITRACRSCGVALERQDRDHCDACMPEELRAGALAFLEKGRAKLAALRVAGEDPAHSGEANQRRGVKVALAQRAFRDWDAAHGSEADPEVFRREILPGLQSVSLGAMAKATGLTEGYCSFVRRGLKVPHRRHWKALAQLGETDVQ